jgi:hypothetical protein
MNVKLVGISKRGKNKINSHGEIWKLLSKGTFKGEPAVLLENESASNLRWVLLDNDPDFESFTAE